MKGFTGTRDGESEPWVIIDDITEVGTRQIVLRVSDARRVRDELNRLLDNKETSDGET